MITQKEIARCDFNRVCELNNYETFTKEQVEGYAGHIKSLIHKSETNNLSGDEIEAINTFNEDLPELHKAIVLNDDLTRELVYYRERKVIFDDVIEKSEGNDIEKARTGIYANTSQNRKLGRVGQKYAPRDKKAEDGDKGSSEGEKPLSVPSMDESLSRDYHNGELTIQEVAEELHEAGWTSSVDIEYAKKMVDKFKGGEKKEGGEGGKVDQKLVDTYTKRLEKVKEQWKTDGTGHQAERAKEYIAHAQRQLDDVKAGKSPFEYQKEEK